MILGITGTDGSGKGTVVDYLVKHKGFMHCSARAIWEEEFIKRGIVPSRDNTRLVANEMRAKYGKDFLVTYYLRKIEEAKWGNVIIESIRTIAEAETLKANGGDLLSVDADQQLRYKRISSRGSITDNVSFEKFKAQEAIEMNDPDPNGMQKAAVMAMADYTIMNEGTLEELQEQVEAVLQKLQNT